MSGLVYFITGGNRGIGFELVKQLSADEKNTVITSTRNVEKSEDLKKLAESNPKVKIVTLDVSIQDSIDALGKQLLPLAPEGIDVYISNAGVADTTVFRPILHIENEVWEHHYRTNTLGPINVAKVVFPFLEKKPTKKIVFTSSVAGSITTFLPFSVSAYGQSKAALNYTTKALSFELAAKGYTVIAVHPGAVITDMTITGNDYVKKVYPNFVSNVTLITAEESARGELEVIKKVTKEDTGKFYDWSGRVRDW